MEEVVMRVMKKVVTVFACMFLLTIFAGSVWAGEWSEWGKVKRIDRGQWHTHMRTTIEFPWGKSYVKVDKEYEDHDGITSLALTALSLDLDVRFNVDDDYATRIAIKNP